MSSTVLKRFIALVTLTLCAGEPGTTFAGSAQAGASVVAHLYRDFAWQAIGGQGELFGEGLAHQNKSGLEKYFDPSLTSLLLRDARCQMRMEGICNLDFDPIFVSQDPNVVDLEIEPATAGTIAVDFKNPTNDEKTKLDFKVALIAGQWKITDVIYRNMDGVSLKKILARKNP